MDFTMHFLGFDTVPTFLLQGANCSQNNLTLALNVSLIIPKLSQVALAVGFSKGSWWASPEPSATRLADVRSMLSPAIELRSLCLEILGILNSWCEGNSTVLLFLTPPGWGTLVYSGSTPACVMSKAVTKLSPCSRTSRNRPPLLSGRTMGPNEMIRTKLMTPMGKLKMPGSKKLNGL